MGLKYGVVVQDFLDQVLIVIGDFLLSVTVLLRLRNLRVHTVEVEHLVCHGGLHVL